MPTSYLRQQALRLATRDDGVIDLSREAEISNTLLVAAGYPPLKTDEEAAAEWRVDLGLGTNVTVGSPGAAMLARIMALEARVTALVETVVVQRDALHDIEQHERDGNLDPESCMWLTCAKANAALAKARGEVSL
jgi:hypothetical protein